MKFESIKDLINRYSEELLLEKNDKNKNLFNDIAFDISKDIPIYNESGSLTVIASRPGMGKTTFILQSAVSIAKHENKSVYILSLEHSSKSLITILLQMLNKPIEKSIADLPIFICDDSSILLKDIEETLYNQIKSGIVFIDYLELIKTDENNSIRQFYEISSNLKTLTKSTNIPIVYSCQLSRRVEKNAKRTFRPSLNNLRNKGTALQDSDIVLFLYRDAYYKYSEIANEPYICADDNDAECIVAKNKYGEIGTAKLNWNGRYFIKGEWK